MKEMSLIEKINAGMANAMITVEGQDFVTKLPNMPTIAGDFSGFTTQEYTTPMHKGFRAPKTFVPREKGVKWYMNWTANASTSARTPIDNPANIYADGFVDVDLSLITAEDVTKGVSEDIGFFGVHKNVLGEWVAMDFLPPFEGKTNMIGVLEVYMPMFFDGEFLFTKEGKLAYETTQLPVYYDKDHTGWFLPNLLKTGVNQIPTGKVQAVTKTGVPMTRMAKQYVDGKVVQENGKDKLVEVPTMVDYYVGTLYQDYVLPITVQQYAFLLSFVEGKVKAVFEARKRNFNR